LVGSLGPFIKLREFSIEEENERSIHGFRVNHMTLLKEGREKDP